MSRLPKLRCWLRTMLMVHVDSSREEGSMISIIHTLWVKEPVTEGALQSGQDVPHGVGLHQWPLITEGCGFVFLYRSCCQICFARLLPDTLMRWFYHINGATVRKTSSMLKKTHTLNNISDVRIHPILPIPIIPVFHITHGKQSK